MSKKFFSLFLSTVLIACVAFAVISVARMVVNKPNDWDNTEPVKIVEKGSSYKHYYDSLSTVQKHTYNQILKNIYSMPEKIEIPSVDDSDIEKVFTALIDDNPDLYFVDLFESRIESYGFRTRCNMSYALTKEEYAESEKKIGEICKKVISGLSSPDNQWQTELEINDYLVDNCEYKYDPEDHFAYSTAYSVLVNGEAACEGYSKAAKMLFDMAGIESMTVRGESIGNGETVEHMWNIVNIDGEYYNFDCTWNDPVSSGSEKEISSIADRIADSEKRYRYFNLSDEMIKDTHIPENNTVKCTATEGNYFNKTATVFDDYNRETEEKIRLLVREAIENGKDYVSFGFADKKDFGRAVESLGKSAKINGIFREYEKETGKKTKKHTIYSVNEEQKIIIDIEYA